MPRHPSDPFGRLTLMSSHAWERTYFTGSALDRASTRRQDGPWLREQMVSPSTRILVTGPGGQVLYRPSGGTSTGGVGGVGMAWLTPDDVRPWWPVDITDDGGETTSTACGACYSWVFLGMTGSQDVLAEVDPDTIGLGRPLFALDLVPFPSMNDTRPATRDDATSDKTAWLLAPSEQTGETSLSQCRDKQLAGQRRCLQGKRAHAQCRPA